MSEYNQKKFSELVKVSKVAIHKAIASGKLKLNANRKIDSDDPMAARYIMLQKNKNKKKKTVIKPDKVIKKKVKLKETKVKLSKVIKKEKPPEVIEPSPTKKIDKKLAFNNVGSIKITSTTPPDMVLEYQDIFKAVKLQEEALTKQLQRKEKEKSLIDVDMGKYLFTSFIDQIKTELSLIPQKQSPNLESLYKNGQDKKAQQLLKREFEGMLKIVVDAQGKALLKWKREK